MTNRQELINCINRAENVRTEKELLECLKTAAGNIDYRENETGTKGGHIPTEEQIALGEMAIMSVLGLGLKTPGAEMMQIGNIKDAQHYLSMCVNKSEEDKEYIEKEEEEYIDRVIKTMIWLVEGRGISSNTAEPKKEKVAVISMPQDMITTPLTPICSYGEYEDNAKAVRITKEKYIQMAAAHEEYVKEGNITSEANEKYISITDSEGKEQGCMSYLSYTDAVVLTGLVFPANSKYKEAGIQDLAYKANMTERKLLKTQNIRYGRT